MDKRYQIFISSTFVDLEEERKKIMEAILELDCFPAGMEMFSASNSEQLDYIKGIINQSDYYIIVIGGRYGSTDENGISYTEKEFDYAIEKKIPVFAFIVKNTDNLALKKTDKDFIKNEKLKAFRKKVETGRLVTYWEETYELKSKILTALQKGFKMFPRDGWIKGSNLSSDIENLLIEKRKCETEISTLNNTIKQLKDSISEKDQQFTKLKLRYETSDLVDINLFNQLKQSNSDYKEAINDKDEIIRQLHGYIESILDSRPDDN